MKMFSNLTKYLQLLEDDDFGTLVVDRENDRNQKKTSQMPYVKYSKTVECFVNDVYEFMDDHMDFELNRYGEILEKNGLQWDLKSMSEADVSSLDAQCVMALVMGVIRADRFFEGTLLDFLKDGSICKWLRRLDEIENYGMNGEKSTEETV